MFKDFRKKFLIPLTGSLITFILVIILCVYFASNLISQSSSRLNTQTSELSSTVESKFENFTNFLKDVQGLFASSTSVSSSEFSTFIKNVDFVNRYPGITTVAFSKKVTLAERQSFFDDLNNDPVINPDGGVKYSPDANSIKDVYYLLNYAEPFTATTAFGFDSTSTDARRINIEKAVSLNDVVMTEKLPLTGVNAGQFGFSIYLPVYKEGSINNTPEERVANNIGVVIGSFRVNNVFGKIFNDESKFKDLSFKIYTDGKEDDSTLLFDSKVNVESINNFSITKELNIANREWDLKFTPANAYGLSDTEKVVPIGTLAIGVILSILVGFYLYQLKKSQNNALEMANDIKAKLDESEARMNSILESVDIIAYAINTKGIFTLSSGKGLIDLGLKQHELEGKSVYEVYKDNPVVIDQISRAIKGETIKETVTVGEVTLESRITPIYDRNGKVVSIVGISHNITETEEANEKLKAKTNELERLNKIMIDRELKMVELKKQLKEK